MCAKASPTTQLAAIWCSNLLLLCMVAHLHWVSPPSHYNKLNWNHLGGCLTAAAAAPPPVPHHRLALATIPFFSSSSSDDSKVAKLCKSNGQPLIHLSHTGLALGQGHAALSDTLPEILRELLGTRLCCEESRCDFTREGVWSPLWACVCCC